MDMRISPGEIPAVFWSISESSLEVELADADYDSFEASMVRVTRRAYDRERKLPSELVAELTKAAALLTHLKGLSHGLFAHLSEMDAIDGAWKLYFDHGESWVIPQHGAIRRVDRLVALIEQPRWRKDAWRIDARMDNRWFIRPASSKEVI